MIDFRAWRIVSRQGDVIVPRAVNAEWALKCFFLAADKPIEIRGCDENGVWDTSAGPYRVELYKGE